MDEGEGCLEGKPRGRGQPGAGTGMVSNSLGTTGSWARGDDGDRSSEQSLRWDDGCQACEAELESIQILQRLKRSKQGLVKKVERIIMIRLFNAAERRTSKIA